MEFGIVSQVGDKISTEDSNVGLAATADVRVLVIVMLLVIFSNFLLYFPYVISYQGEFVQHLLITERDRINIYVQCPFYSSTT